MINKVGSSTNLSSIERKQTTATTENAWERYARDIEELKRNPPKMYAVTIPEFMMGGMSFPTWQIPDFIEAGFDPKTFPTAYEKRRIVTEKFLQILQKEVPGYLRDIVEVDPHTGQPLEPRKSHLTQRANESRSEQMASSSSTTAPTLQQTTTLTRTERIQPTASSRAAHKSSSTAMATKETKLAQPLQEQIPFDFTKLSPEVQRTTLQLTEQLLTVALQRLSKTDQLGAEFSSLLNRTA